MIQLSIRPAARPQRGTEHRRYLRVPLELAVSYRVGAAQEWLPGKSANISVGGLFVEAEVSPPIGTAITCAVRQQDAVVLTGTGTVRWHRVDGPHRGFGVQFATLDAQTHARVLQIIDAYLRENDLPPPVEPKRPEAWWKGVVLASAAAVAGSFAWVLLHS